MLNETQRRLFQAIHHLKEPGGSNIKTIMKLMNVDEPSVTLKKVVKLLKNGVDEGLLKKSGSRFKLKYLNRIEGDDLEDCDEESMEGDDARTEDDSDVYDQCGCPKRHMTTLADVPNPACPMPGGRCPQAKPACPKPKPAWPKAKPKPSCPKKKPSCPKKKPSCPKKKPSCPKKKKPSCPKKKKPSCPKKKKPSCPKKKASCPKKKPSCPKKKKPSCPKRKKKVCNMDFFDK